MTGHGPDRAGVTGEHLRKASAASFFKEIVLCWVFQLKSKLVPSSFMPGVACVLGAGFPSTHGVGERSSSSIPGRRWGPLVEQRRAEVSGPLVLVLAPCGTLIVPRAARRPHQCSTLSSRPGHGSASHTSARTGPDTVISSIPARWQPHAAFLRRRVSVKKAGFTSRNFLTFHECDIRGRLDKLTGEAAAAFSTAR